MKHCPFTKRGTRAPLYLELSSSLEGAFTLLQLNANQLIIKIDQIMNIFASARNRFNRILKSGKNQELRNFI